MKFWLLVLFCASFSYVQGTTLASIDVTKLYEEADVVALVTIEQGQLLRHSGEDCGAKYSGRIKELLKGQLPIKSLINFSTYSLVSLGDTFLIFVSKSGNQVRHLASTNTFSQRLEQQRQNACSQHLPKYQVIHSGTAMLKSYYAPIPNIKESFVIFGPIRIPKNMKSYFISQKNRPDKCKLYGSCIRVGVPS